MAPADVEALIADAEATADRAGEPPVNPPPQLTPAHREPLFAVKGRPVSLSLAALVATWTVLFASAKFGLIRFGADEPAVIMTAPPTEDADPAPRPAARPVASARLKAAVAESARLADHFEAAAAQVLPAPASADYIARTIASQRARAADELCQALAAEGPDIRAALKTAAALARQPQP